MAQETELGFEFHFSSGIIFFGKKKCTLADLKSYYPQFEFRTVHQTHSDITVKSIAQSDRIQADAHYTSEMNVGLAIKTADCLPIMMYAPDRKMIFAVHAGWRGVENQITLKALHQLQFSKQDFLQVYIGPHILQSSFEVQADVKNLLVQSSCCGLTDMAYAQDEKYFVDLQKIVKSQIQSIVPQAQIEFMNVDTYRNPQFNSYRTDQTTLRNLSFIVQKAAPV